MGLILMDLARIVVILAGVECMTQIRDDDLIVPMSDYTPDSETDLVGYDCNPINLKYVTIDLDS